MTGKKCVQQAAIADVLSETCMDLCALEQIRDRSRPFKQGMMQELLTAPLRRLNQELLKERAPQA